MRKEKVVDKLALSNLMGFYGATENKEMSNLMG